MTACLVSGSCGFRRHDETQFPFRNGAQALPAPDRGIARGIVPELQLPAVTERRSELQPTKQGRQCWIQPLTDAFSAYGGASPRSVLAVGWRPEQQEAPPSVYP